LQTLCWIEWYKDDKNNFVRSWGGDHWQVIEVNDCRKMALSKGLGGSAAQTSTAKTAVKLPLHIAGPSRKLEFINCDAGQQTMNDPMSVAECGLEYDFKNEKWTNVPGINLKASTKSQNETDGSLKQGSWKVLRTKLLEACDAQSGIPCPEHIKSDEQVQGRRLRSGISP
jgi:hypothetical protein